LFAGLLYPFSKVVVGEAFLIDLLLKLGACELRLRLQLDNFVQLPNGLLRSRYHIACADYLLLGPLVFLLKLGDVVGEVPLGKLLDELPDVRYLAYALYDE